MARGQRIRWRAQSLCLSNGGTEVFIDVLMPAVSDFADDVGDYRFAALLTLQDQNVMGRGPSASTCKTSGGAQLRTDVPGRRASCCKPPHWR